MNKPNCTYYSDTQFVNDDNLELLFVYINKYRHFKDFSFGANAKYLFEYKDNTLKIEDNPKYVKLFPNNINLKILCGKNGVGKTSILKLLHNIDKYPDCFIVYKNEQGKYYTNKKDLKILYNNEKPFYCNTICSVLRSFHYSLQNNDSILYIEMPHLHEKFCKKYISNIELFKKFSQQVLYKYVNIPDFTHFNIRFSMEDDVINNFIGDTNKMFGTIISETNVLNYAHKNPVKFEIMNEICSWLVCNTDEQIQLDIEDDKFGEEYLENLFIQLIDENVIPHIEKINNELRGVILNSVDKKFINSLKNLIYSYIDFCQQKETSCDIHNLIFEIKNIIKYLSFNNKHFYTSLPKEIKLQPFINVVLKGHYSEKSIDEIFDFILKNINCVKRKNDKIFESLLYNYENKFHFKEYPLNTVKEIYATIDRLNSKLRPLQIRINQIIQKNNQNTNPNIRFDLNNLFYPKIFIKSNNGAVYFNDLSSGQKLMLMNLINIHTTTIRACDKPKTLIINDDVDAYLHPDWCREYLSIYINTIKEYLTVYPEYSNRKFNIIMATHSPIILSDVTSEYVTYLESDNTGTPQEVFSKENSFAGNIGQMYNDNFFMDNLIGDYSNSILEEVIHYIKGNNKNNKLIKDKPLEFIHSDNDCENFINAVGDKLLRTLLMDEYQIMKEGRQYEED